MRQNRYYAGNNGALGSFVYNGAYSGVDTGDFLLDALASKGGTWDWNTMSEWLANPKKFAPGTKMTFAGLSNPEDRANVIAFLNSRSDAPMPLPAAPAEATAEAAPAEGNAVAEAPAGNDAASAAAAQ